MSRFQDLGVRRLPPRGAGFPSPPVTVARTNDASWLAFLRPGRCPDGEGPILQGVLKSRSSCADPVTQPPRRLTTPRILQPQFSALSSNSGNPEI